MTSYGRSRACWTRVLTKFLLAGAYEDTSPAVTFAPGTGARIDIGGKALLVEPDPMLLDHIALCAKGVWTQSRPSPAWKHTDAELAEAA